MPMPRNKAMQPTGRGTSLRSVPRPAADCQGVRPAELSLRCLLSTTRAAFVPLLPRAFRGPSAVDESNVSLLRDSKPFATCDAVCSVVAILRECANRYRRR